MHVGLNSPGIRWGTMPFSFGLAGLVTGTHSHVRHIWPVCVSNATSGLRVITNRWTGTLFSFVTFGTLPIALLLPSALLRSSQPDIASSEARNGTESFVTGPDYTEIKFVINNHLTPRVPPALMRQSHEQLIRNVEGGCGQGKFA
jgi:hypothetical protein